MPNRRTFLGLTAGALVAPRIARAEDDKAMTGRSFFYVSRGPSLQLYLTDPDFAGLIERGVVQLPENIQYAWPHPTVPFLYVACSNGGSGTTGAKGDRHFLSALRIDKASGELQAMGSPAALRSRPIHVFCCSTNPPPASHRPSAPS